MSKKNTWRKQTYRKETWRRKRQGKDKGRKQQKRKEEGRKRKGKGKGRAVKKRKEKNRGNLVITWDGFFRGKCRIWWSWLSTFAAQAHYVSTLQVAFFEEVAHEVRFKEVAAAQHVVFFHPKRVSGAWEVALQTAGCGSRFEIMLRSATRGLGVVHVSCVFRFEILPRFGHSLQLSAPVTIRLGWSADPRWWLDGRGIVSAFGCTCHGCVVGAEIFASGSPAWRRY